MWAGALGWAPVWPVPLAVREPIVASFGSAALPVAASAVVAAVVFAFASAQRRSRVMSTIAPTAVGVALVAV